ncbi:MAG: polysaccharide biosynthesis C-terminal domain-containing protein, partial [Saprospiraceae bacterium]
MMVSAPLTLVETAMMLRKEYQRLMLYAHWSQVGLLILISLTALWSPTLESFIYAMVMWSLIRFSYLVFFIIGKNIGSLNIKKLSGFLVFSLPLMVNMLLGSAMDIIDGTLVSHFFSAEYFPVFRYGARELPLSGLLFSSLSAAMIPVLISNGLSDGRIKERVTALMHFLFPITILLMWLSPFLFPIFYDAAFKESAYIFNIYLLLLCSRVLLPQSYNFALHQHKIVIFSSIIEILFNVVLSLWWVKIWGIQGLAMATVVSYFIQKIILIAYNKHCNNIPLHQYLDVKKYLFYSLLTLISFVLTLQFMQ